jgi:tetratricopeptide repeat protein 21B
LQDSQVDPKKYADVVFLYASLIEALIKRWSERDTLESTLEKAMALFQHGPEFSKFQILKAKYYVSLRKFDDAIVLLERISPEDRYYMESRLELSNIFLDHKKDKNRYTSCLREIVKKRPTVESCLMLGEAYMKIQDVEIY